MSSVSAVSAVDLDARRRGSPRSRAAQLGPSCGRMLASDAHGPDDTSRFGGSARSGMDLDKETEERIDAAGRRGGERETRLTPAEAVEKMHINLPVRGNRKLRKLLERVNEDEQLKGWWHVSNVNAVVADGDQRPLLGAHPDRREHRAEAPPPADEARRRAVGSSATSGSSRTTPRSIVVARRALPLRRHVGPPARATRTSRSSSPSRRCGSCSRGSTRSPT